MIVPYYSKCLVLRSASHILRLPSECVSSALILLHKYKQARLQDCEISIDDDVKFISFYLSKLNDLVLSASVLSLHVCSLQLNWKK